MQKITIGGRDSGLCPKKRGGRVKIRVSNRGTWINCLGFEKGEENPTGDFGRKGGQRKIGRKKGRSGVLTAITLKKSTGGERGRRYASVKRKEGGVDNV